MPLKKKKVKVNVSFCKFKIIFAFFIEFLLRTKDISHSIISLAVSALMFPIKQGVVSFFVDFIAEQLPKEVKVTLYPNQVFPKCEHLYPTIKNSYSSCNADCSKINAYYLSVLLWYSTNTLRNGLSLYVNAHEKCMNSSLPYPAIGK